MNDHFVLLLNHRNQPERLQGPATYEQCKEHFLSHLRSEGIILDAEEILALDTDGSHTYWDGAGLFILSAEPFAA